MEPFIGQIQLFGFNFAPRGWAFCSGQLLAINQYSALFSLLGTTYGGDGRTTFGLPDLRGRVAVGGGYGQGPGLSNIRLGEKSGNQDTFLTVQNLPSHNHQAAFAGTPAPVSTSAAGTSSDPTGLVPANSGRRDPEYAEAGESPNRAAPAGTITVGNTGGSQSFSNRQPYLGLNFCIALVGIYPSRN